MTRNSLLRFLPLLLVLLLGACASNTASTTGSETPTASTSETEDEDDEETEGLGDTYDGDGYEIQPPEDWDVLEGDELEEQQIEADVLFRNPEDDDGFFANININQTDIEGETLEQIVEDSKELLVQQYPDYEFLTDESIEVDGAEAHEFEAQFSFNEGEYHNLQWLVVEDDTQYTITATTSDASWDEHEDLIRASFETFVVS